MLTLLPTAVPTPPLMNNPVARLPFTWVLWNSNFPKPLVTNTGLNVVPDVHACTVIFSSTTLDRGNTDGVVQ